MARRILKQHAKIHLKKHYWIFVLLCVMAGVLGTGYSSALEIIKMPASAKELENSAASPSDDETEAVKIHTVGMGLDAVYAALLSDQVEQAENDSKEYIREAEQSEDKNYGIVQIGRRRGVLSFIVNKVSSGALYLTVFSGIRSLVGSDNAATVIFILLSMIFVTFVWLLVTNYFQAVWKRIYLEGRVYEELPFGRMLFLVRRHKVIKTVWTLTLKTIYHSLWCLTVVGGIIKYFSYYMVPYIVAENPDISPVKAIKLSRNMMNGHKWECFKLEVSFIGWEILSLCTLGLSALFFSNPYREAVFCEYFVYLRRIAKEKEIEDAELLNDTYLYEKADICQIKQAYTDIPEQWNSNSNNKCRSGLGQVIANVFGIVFRYDKYEDEYRQNAVSEIKYRTYVSVLSGKSYPGRLYLIPEKERTKKHTESLLYLRHYSVTSLILLFFSFSFIGWIWEVSLHLISDGVFVNRGVLHGPWLPIYGTGGTLILIALNKLRNKPGLEFAGAVILAGIVEYFTAWQLEATHGGQKWWDYSGYFLNIHGRVCAEGLLVFGLGGITVVYFAAPLLDNLFRRIKPKLVIIICAALLLAYTGDQAYSSRHPNSGEGITSVPSLNNSAKDAG